MRDIRDSFHSPKIRDQWSWRCPYFISTWDVNSVLADITNHLVVRRERPFQTLFFITTHILRFWMEAFKPGIPSLADTADWLAQHLISTFSFFSTPVIETEKVKCLLSQPPLEPRMAMWLMRNKRTSAEISPHPAVPSAQMRTCYLLLWQLSCDQEEKSKWSKLQQSHHWATEPMLPAICL